MIAPSDHWGPFSPAISHPERVARLRALRMAAQLTARNSMALQKALWLAESGDLAELEAALLEVDRLPALTRRNLLSSYNAHQDAHRTFKAPPRQLEGAG